MNKCLGLAFWNLKTIMRKKISRTCHSYYYSKHAWEEHKPDEKGFSSIKLNSSENIQNTCFAMNVVLKLWFYVTPLLGVCCSKLLIKNLAKYQWLLLIKFFLLQVLAGKLRGLHILDMLSRTSTLIIFSSIADEAGLSVCEEVEIFTKMLTSLSPPPHLIKTLPKTHQPKS